MYTEIKSKTVLLYDFSAIYVKIYFGNKNCIAKVLINVVFCILKYN